MGQQVSIIELKEQIEAAKRSLAETPAVNNAAEHQSQSVAMPTKNFADLAVGHEGDAPRASDQNMVANDDIATDDIAADDMAIVDDFQFFHRPKRSDRPFDTISSMGKENADFDCHGDDQSLFQALDQRLDRLENNITKNREHILELITLLSGLDMAAKPNRRNLMSLKHSPRRNLYWFLIGFLVISWAALTPSGHYWFNHFLGLM